MTDPTLRILSLGAGVQSSALLILAARGDLPKPDAAIFSDTGWEPAAVYAHLDRLEREVAAPAGIPIYRVSSGNIRDDALNPNARFATMPLFIKSKCATCGGTGNVKLEGFEYEAYQVEDLDNFNEETGEYPMKWIPAGYTPPVDEPCTACNGTGSTQGIQRRQCTSEYKLKPIKRKVRELLGYPHPTPIPKGVFVEQWIGISTDEMDRALDENGELKTGDVKYSRNRYPLLELDMSRDKCRTLLDSHGFELTPKSACIGCPFHTNAHWRSIKENPADWDDAVDFDKAIRGGSARANANGQALRGEAYLHRSMVPLDQAPIEWENSREWSRRQSDVLSLLAVTEYEERLTAEERDGLTGCSPFGCAPDTDEEAA